MDATDQSPVEGNFWTTKIMRDLTVTCPECDNRYVSDQVPFVNIESDFEERDVLTFTCPECKKDVQSHVRG